MKFLSLVTFALAALPAVFATQPDVEERSPILAERELEKRTFILCKILGGCGALKQKRCTIGQKLGCWRNGQQCDDNCRCVGGNQPDIPGGGQLQCNRPDQIEYCWSIGQACDSKCYCVKPPDNIGQCTSDHIRTCAREGFSVDSQCNCYKKCTCFDQWRCCLKGGKLDRECNCIPGGPSGRPYKRRDHSCPVGETVCGIMGSKDSGYECINTQSNLESCGGCASTGSGVDCSAIEGAADVSCIAGKCIVGSCLPGYTAVNGNSCVADVTGGPLLFAQN